MAMVRSATANWSGDLQTGKGEVGVETGVFGGLPTSWRARTESADRMTSPEELLAAAHASCYCMALAHELAEAGTPAERLQASATIDFDPDEGVTASHIEVLGRVAGIDQDAFADAASRAGEGCPISGALKGNLQISVKPRLDS